MVLKLKAIEEKIKRSIDANLEVIFVVDTTC